MSNHRAPTGRCRIGHVAMAGILLGMVGGLTLPSLDVRAGHVDAAGLAASRERNRSPQTAAGSVSTGRVADDGRDHRARDDRGGDGRARDDRGRDDRGARRAHDDRRGTARLVGRHARPGFAVDVRARSLGPRRDRRDDHDHDDRDSDERRGADELDRHRAGGHAGAGGSDIRGDRRGGLCRSDPGGGRHEYRYWRHQGRGRSRVDGAHAGPADVAGAVADSR